MEIADYFNAAHAAQLDPFHLRKHEGFYDLNFHKDDKVVLPFISKLIWSHDCLRMGICGALSKKDHRLTVLGAAGHHAEQSSKLILRELRAPDLLQAVSVSVSSGPWVADDPEVWLNLGLSALVLELVMNHVRSLSAIQGAAERFHGLMGAMGRGFGLERAFALAEAGRCANGKDDPRLKKAISKFVPPGEMLWGEPFVAEALEAMRGRVDSRRYILRSAVNALDAAPGLPRNRWLYAEPHLNRLGPRFGIGWKTKLAVRAALKIA